jgi:SAM-dependent methyltransferase
MSPDQRLHPSAAIGFQRGVDEYERGRPDFPTDAIDMLHGWLGLVRGRTLLELGAGTGKLTAMLAPSGVRVVAIEPVAAMREALARNVPNIQIVDGLAEELPLEADSIDAAVAAQAFHWFDGDRVLHELSRVLRRDGRLALVWNVRDETVPWILRLTELMEPYRGDTPSHRSMRWKQAFDTTDGFAPPTLHTFPYIHRTTREGTVARVLSVSFMATLSDEEKDRVAEEVRRIVPGEEVSFAYRTDVWTTGRV